MMLELLFNPGYFPMSPYYKGFDDMDFINDGEIVRPRYTIKCIKTKRWWWFDKKEYAVENERGHTFLTGHKSYDAAAYWLDSAGVKWNEIKVDESCY